MIVAFYIYMKTTNYTKYDEILKNGTPAQICYVLKKLDSEKKGMN